MHGAVRRLSRHGRKNDSRRDTRCWADRSAGSKGCAGYHLHASEPAALRRAAHDPASCYQQSQPAVCDACSQRIRQRNVYIQRRDLWRGQRSRQHAGIDCGGTARSGSTAGRRSCYGKSRGRTLARACLFVANVLRAFHGATDANNSIVYLALDMGGEFLFNSGSVFNFFSPLYEIPAADFNTPPPSPLPLSGPEFQIFTSASSLARVNDIEFLIFNPSFDGSTRIDLSAYAAIASNDNDLGIMVDAMNLQLLHGTMSDQMKTQILNAVSAVSSGDPLGRARTAAHLIVSSSQYQVQR